MEYNWIDGTDTVNGVIWKKLFTSSRPDFQDKDIFGYYRQEGTKIYERRVWASGEELILQLFDFGAKEGDTVFVHNFEYQVIDRVFDTVFNVSDGTPRRCLQVSAANNRNLKDFWVEGIGSLRFGMTASWLDYSGWMSELLCCENDGDLWYQNGLYNSCSIESEPEDYLEDGKTWTMQSGVGDGPLWYYTESLAGESEKYGYVWKHLFTGEREFLHLRQDGKKIWAFYPYHDGGMDTVPFLMFDFGLSKGDTAHLYVDTFSHIDDAWIVDDVFDSVFETGQTARRCLKVHLMEYTDRDDIWVDGIGSLANGLTYSPSRNLRGPSMLVCVERATGELLYHKYSACRIPSHYGYDYSVQHWSVLCKDTPRHTEELYFKTNGEQQWNWAYRATKEDFSDEKPFGLYYQDRLQVYFKENENAPAVLLYDFGLEKGESTLVSGNVLWTADSVYSQNIEGIERRCQQMVSDNGETDVWIEGIGSLKTGFFPVNFFNNPSELLCVQADVFWHRNYMYHNTKYDACHIEETVGNKTATASDVSVHYEPQQKSLIIGNGLRGDVLEVVDVQGRCVLRVNNPAQKVSVTRLPHGLYVYRLTVNGTVCSGKFLQ
ncbi:MAG: T9SS type A sorting domain-containing protein [Bacteroides sp.]|nr:T9SS type A sorting domain-containing protein [Bacteroides sp.]MCM1086042.1 T9SS type A sorting domain-containing protein [Bacteroides sp.]